MTIVKMEKVAKERIEFAAKKLGTHALHEDPIVNKFFVVRFVSDIQKRDKSDVTVSICFGTKIYSQNGSEEPLCLTREKSFSFVDHNQSGS